MFYVEDGAAGHRCGIANRLANKQIVVLTTVKKYCIYKQIP